MGLPLFNASDDPGPSFFHFAQMTGLTPPVSNLSASSAHATTVIAVRYNGGVVMVGDRQATGNYIASRDIRKIEAADHFTAIAISGTAARGIEFIRMAQLSFEHYEKMTDTALSLEGKANYLSPIIQRNNLTSPLLVVPLLAGWDVAGPGRADLRVRRCRRMLRALRLLDDRLRHALRRRDTASRVQRRPRPRRRDRTRRARDLRGRRQRPEYRGTGLRAQPLPDDRHYLRRRASRSSTPSDVAGRFRVINERRTQSGGVAGGTLR